MKFSDNAMSAILLCSYIGINSSDACKPLTMKEWNELLDRVVQYGQQPSVVMGQGQNFLKEAGYSQEYIERIQRLVFRGGTVAFELDDLEGKGIDIVTMFDADYPVLMKRRLKRKIPPVLFYSGDIGLAKKIGIGVAGSRNVDDEGIRFTRNLVEKAAEERLVVYSGGAKGVDAAAEKAAIESGSAAVSFLAESMLSKMNKKDILDSIINKRRLLLSDIKPDAGFSPARAMNRNKYIYTSSYGTFVVASDYNKGGTWSGAVEALKNEWTKVLVWNQREYEGNSKLIEKGAVPYQLSKASIFELITRKEEKFQQVDLFSYTRGVSEDMGEDRIEPEDRGVEGSLKEAENGTAEISRETLKKGMVERHWEEPEDRTAEVSQELPEGRTVESSRKEPKNQAGEGMDLYHVIAPYVVECIGEGMTKDEAAEAFHVAKGQMYIWLKQLCQDSYLECVQGRFVKRL